MAINKKIFQSVTYIFNTNRAWCKKVPAEKKYKSECIYMYDFSLYVQIYTICTHLYSSHLAKETSDERFPCGDCRWVTLVNIQFNNIQWTRDVHCVWIEHDISQTGCSASSRDSVSFAYRIMCCDQALAV